MKPKPPPRCVFCRGDNWADGRPYEIHPFGWACRSCCDGFFSSRTRRNQGWTAGTQLDRARALKVGIGPPYRGHPLKVDASDAGGLPDQIVGYACPDRLNGAGLYVYSGPFDRRVFRSAQADGDTMRPRLNWHLSEWRRIAGNVRTIVYRECHEADQDEVLGYYVIEMNQALALTKRYRTPKGERSGPPLEACEYFGPQWRDGRPAAPIRELVKLAAVGDARAELGDEWAF